MSHPFLEQQQDVPPRHAQRDQPVGVEQRIEAEQPLVERGRSGEVRDGQGGLQDATDLHREVFVKQTRRSPDFTFRKTTMPKRALVHAAFMAALKFGYAKAVSTREYLATNSSGAR